MEKKEIFERIDKMIKDVDEFNRNNRLFSDDRLEFARTNFIKGVEAVKRVIEKLDEQNPKTDADNYDGKGSLIVWFGNEEIFTFRRVNILSFLEDSHEISFKYYSPASKEICSAKINKANILGYEIRKEAEMAATQIGGIVEEVGQ